MSIFINRVSKKFKDQWALKDVSIELKKGEVLGLLGPNGAGKSTLMKCIVGLVTPTKGDITVNHQSITNDAIAIKKQIGYLPENNPLYTEMYVQEYLQFVANIRDLNPKEVNHVIEQVGLAPEKHKKIKALSKGYKQRVGIAQAIIHQPEILILDEPTNGLDPNQIIEIRNLIQQVGKDKTVILSTHIMQEVAALCHRVVLLNRGKKLADQSIQDFQGAYTSLEDAFHHLTTANSTL